MLDDNARANPIAGNPLAARGDVARAVIELYEPLLPYTSAGGARVRLGSFAAVFQHSTAELEGFARPLYGVVPLTVGGGDFPHWDHIASGLEAGSDPNSVEFWGPVPGDGDQRMVEQAAIGLALAFCPERAWNPLDRAARDHLVRWLHGIFEHDPVPNNWQFFRVLVALGLERVGAPFDRAKVAESLDLIDSYRLGDRWYADGALRNVDYYVPFAFHTYGLMYAAANDIGLGDDHRARVFRERAAAFASDFELWFAPDGSAVPFGRSLTYRFAMSSFWGTLAWADVDSGVTWGEAKGLLLRHLRWWADKPISDRDGVLSVGFTYDNRRLCETYNSAGSPYWAMKAFSALAAPAAHPFWRSDEQPLPRHDEPVPIPDAGQVACRDDDQTALLMSRPSTAFDFPEQAAAKYRKFAYSSAFGFSGDVADIVGAIHTDSMLALTDAEGDRRVRLGIEAAGVEGAMVWSTWHPWPDVRVDSVCWAINACLHGRLHRVRTGRDLRGDESGFAVGWELDANLLMSDAVEEGPDRAALTAETGCSAIAGIDSGRSGLVRPLAVNANLISPRTAVPLLRGDLPLGEHRLAAVVFASPTRSAPTEIAAIPPAAERLLERIAGAEPS